MTTWILGCGAVGRLVAEKELARGDRVVAVTQRSETISNVEPFLINFDGSPQTYPQLPEPENMYCFYPPPPKGQIDSRTQHVITFLASCKRKPRRVVLISTTSIYGDCQGEWVDESRPPNPQTDRAKRR
ncbi:MAG: SDR family NAD(P)-dependent oxidoreductase, partial [Gammaproteobacteria bacterium]|nr:SDR family NAD(P)-dependent oxidoreductase [Gammaproteobacteria bacterium]